MVAMWIQIDGGKVEVELEDLRASETDPNEPSAIFFRVYRREPSQVEEYLGEFNWEAGRDYSEPKGPDVAMVTKVIAALKGRRKKGPTG